MFDAALAFNLVEHLSRAAVPGEPPGYNRVLSRHRGPHRTADGWVAMLPYTDAHWTALFQAVGEEQLLEQPWFADHRSRLDPRRRGVRPAGVDHHPARRRPSGSSSAPRSASRCRPVPPLAEIVDDPANHRGVLQDAEHPVVGPYRSIAAAARVLGVRAAPVRRRRRSSPSTPTELLAELGYDDSPTIAELTAAGVVRGPSAR